MLKRFLHILISLSVILAAAACHRVTPQDLQIQMKSANPQWDGDFFAGYYASHTPVFEFTDGPSVNAVALTGSGILNFKPLKDVRLRIFCLRNSNLKSLSFLPELNWEPEVVIELLSCKDLTDLSALKTLPLTIASISNTPFADTALLGNKLESVYLDKTDVKQLNFTNPAIIRELMLIQKTGSPDADLKQINRMKHLASLVLQNRQRLDDIDFSNLAYLESLALTHIDHVRLSPFSAGIIGNLYLENCKDVVIGKALNNRVIDRFSLLNCGDPAKILNELSNTKINLLVISNAHVSDISFLKRIKDLKCVHFQNCTGLPQNIDLPFVEVIVK